MDGVSAAAAILQLAQMAGQAALELYELVTVIRNAPHEITTISRDVHAFYVIVRNLENSLATESVFAIVNADADISSALWTLELPIRNCHAAFDKVKEKLRPHLKSETLAAESGLADGEETPSAVHRIRMSSAGFFWYFKRKDVLTLVTELERTKATFADAMGSITFLLTLRIPAPDKHKALKGAYEFNSDLGSALNDYAASIVDERKSADYMSIVSETQSIVSSTTTATPDAQPTNLEAAESLKMAVSNNSVFLLKAILPHVRVDTRDRKGRTALSHAAEQGKLEIAKVLVEAGASNSARQWSVTGWAEGRNPYSESGASPLYHAIANHHKDIAELLLNHGANPEARTTSGCRPLQLAAVKNDIEIVKLLLSKHVDLDGRNFKDGFSPLHETFLHNYLDISKLLLDAGASPNVPLTAPVAKTPLHFGVHEQSLEGVELLLQHRVDPNTPMIEDVTPLHLAAAGGWVAGIEILVQYGGYVNARDALLHESPLHKAARNCQRSAIDKLCEAGADQRARNVDGLSYQEILEFATADPEEWCVDAHLAIYISKKMCW